jgi:alanine racemase
MWQAEIRVDLAAIRHNVATLRAMTGSATTGSATTGSATTGSGAEIMTVVKADGYGHGMVPVARAALQAGATWLGVCTLDEALTLRAAGIQAPVLAWLFSPGQPLHLGVAQSVDLSAGSPWMLTEIMEAARVAGRPARVHLKVDTGLSRGGATAASWTGLVEAAAKAQADGLVEVVGVWSHLACADEPAHPSVTRQLRAFDRACARASRAGLDPRYRHLANSPATLTRPDTHFDLVRPGIACYGLSPVPGQGFGLRPAMTVRAWVTQAKRARAGQGVSYGHTYTTQAATTLAVVPMGYGDGLPRHASNTGPVWLAGGRRTVAGRVCMDQIVVDCGNDPVRAGDEAILFGPGDAGEPTADDWAAAAGTINYEIVTRIGGVRVPRVYVNE